jgi:hypothetical protein
VVARMFRGRECNAREASRIDYVVGAPCLRIDGSSALMFPKLVLANLTQV